MKSDDIYGKKVLDPKPQHKICCDRTNPNWADKYLPFVVGIILVLFMMFVGVPMMNEKIARDNIERAKQQKMVEYIEKNGVKYKRVD